MGRMSREKGKRGERFVAAAFRDWGYAAHRTAQFRGNTGQAADLEGVPYIHPEVKFCERMTLYDWMTQAEQDARAEGKGNFPAVFHKQNNKQLLVTMNFEQWIQLYKEYEASRTLEGGTDEKKKKNISKYEDPEILADAQKRIDTERG